MRNHISFAAALQYSCLWTSGIWGCCYRSHWSGDDGASNRKNWFRWTCQKCTH